MTLSSCTQRKVQCLARKSTYSTCTQTAEGLRYTFIITACISKTVAGRFTEHSRRERWRKRGWGGRCCKTHNSPPSAFALSPSQQRHGSRKTFSWPPFLDAAAMVANACRGRRIHRKHKLIPRRTIDATAPRRGPPTW